MADLPPGLPGWACVIAACQIDGLLGDPGGWLHPVQCMGSGIHWLRRHLEPLARGRPWLLRLVGVTIAAVTLVVALGCGVAVEICARRWPLPGVPVLVVGLASCLAGKSLRMAVTAVLDALEQPGDLWRARKALAAIVGRDVEVLDRRDMLRAAAETASENAVDGAFAPLFWMLGGVALHSAFATAMPLTPGPLALGFGCKAVSTLDSMLGYRTGSLRWLGTAAARLDDAMVWLPCRLAVASVGILAGRPLALPRRAFRDGAADPSPNAGVSMAAYAHAVGIQLGGWNRYGGIMRQKPLLAAGSADPHPASVRAVLRFTRRGLLLWQCVASVPWALWALGLLQAGRLAQ